MVREPDTGVFDETVAPGAPIQAALDRCREGGFILLQPGMHTLKERLLIAREVHVFGRGLARLRVNSCDGIICSAAAATLDGLTVERTRDHEKFVGVRIQAGRLRLQNSVVTGSFKVGLAITRGSDPFIVACRCVPHHCIRPAPFPSLREREIFP